jgi:hypothetical protein
VLYFVGALAALRYAAFRLQDKIDREDHRYGIPPGTRSWLQHDLSFPVVTGAVFWPLVTLFLILRFATFPRGVTSKFARERAKELELKKRERVMKEQAEEILRLCKENGLIIPPSL